MSVYLYGFVRPGGTPPPRDLHGVSGAPVRTVDLGAVSAVVSDVPSDDFDAAALEARVRDLEWLSEQGALHERVVTWLVDRDGVLPVRFLTLYSDESSLREEAGPRAGALADRLERLEGLREWDLKISWNAALFAEKVGEVSEEVAALDRELAEATPGRRYLLERKRERIAREESSRAARRVASEAWDELAGGAERARRLGLPSSTGDRPLPVILNGALLVRRPDEDDSVARARKIGERLDRLGLTLEYTGPWAPYRFIGDDDGEDGGEDDAGDDGQDGGGG